MVGLSRRYENLDRMHHKTAAFLRYRGPLWSYKNGTCEHSGTYLTRIARLAVHALPTIGFHLWYWLGDKRSGEGNTVQVPFSGFN